MDMILTPRELAPLLRRSERTITRQLRKGEIRGVKVGGRWLVNASREWPGLFGERGGGR